MVSVKAAALLAAAGMAAADISVPTTVNSTLVFPRNATYDANTLLPLVLAVNNVDAATVLDVDVWYYLSNSNSSNTYVAENRLTLSTNGTLKIGVTSLDAVFGTAGEWQLRLELSSVNCTAGTATSDTASNYYPSSQIRTIFFTTTTDGSGAQPDIAAAAANVTCGNGTSSNTASMYIASTLNATIDGTDGFSSDVCAVQPILSDEEEYALPSSCAVSLDDAAVAEVSATATQNACSKQTPVISCPAETTTSTSAASGLRSAGGAGLAAAIAGALALAM